MVIQKKKVFFGFLTQCRNKPRLFDFDTRNQFIQLLISLIPVCITIILAASYYYTTDLLMISDLNFSSQIKVKQQSGHGFE